MEQISQILFTALHAKGKMKTEILEKIAAKYSQNEEATENLSAQEFSEFKQANELENARVPINLLLHESQIAKYQIQKRFMK